MLTKQEIIIIAGRQGQGKTTRCNQLAKELSSKGERIGGFIAPGTWKNGQRYSFDLTDLRSLKSYPFASREAQDGWEKIHGFYFNPESIKKGEDILRTHSEISDWLFIDEVGKFETQGKIWGPILRELLDNHIALVLCVRDSFVEEVIKHFEIKNPMILNI